MGTSQTAEGLLKWDVWEKKRVGSKNVQNQFPESLECLEETLEYIGRFDLQGGDKAILQQNQDRPGAPK